MVANNVKYKCAMNGSKHAEPAVMFAVVVVVLLSGVV